MSPSRVRVAIVTPSLRGGGLERVVRDLALGLDPGVFEVEVFGVSGEIGVYAADLEAAGIPAWECPRPRWIRGVPVALIRHLRRFRPHVVHAHSGTWYAAALACSVLGIDGLVYTEHGRYPPEPWSRAVLGRWCARRTAAIYAVSGETAAYLQDFLRLPERPGLLPNGVDLGVFRPLTEEERAERRAGWGAAPGDVVAISVGRFAPVKNHEGMVRATAEARARGAPLRTVFVGVGALEDDVRRLAETLGLGDAVRFLGFHEQVAPLLGAADVYVNASSTEGMPLSILEALGTGLPVVATAVGGVPEVLGTPPAGLLVPPGDDGALADALAGLATDAPRLADLAGRAAKRAHHYSLEAFAERHADLFLRVAGGSAEQKLRPRRRGPRHRGRAHRGGE